MTPAYASTADPCERPAKKTNPTAEDNPLCASELEITLEFASAYVFRGLNLFQVDHQADQNPLLSPHVDWTAPGTRWSVGYSAAYQLGGANIWDNVDSGLASDQIFYVDYALPLAQHIKLTPEVGTYIYPQAKDVPLFLEPSAELEYEGSVNVNLFGGYLAGIRPGALSEDYLYLRPRVEKTFEITRTLDFELRLSAGVKLFSSHLGSINDNMFDVLASETLSYSLTEIFYVEAKLAMAWTNLSPRRDPTTRALVNSGFADECIPFWGITLGADL